MEMVTKNYIVSVSNFDSIESHDGYVYDSIDEIVRFKEGHRVYGLGENIVDWSRFKRIDWHYSRNGSKPLDGVEIKIEKD